MEPKTREMIYSQVLLRVRDTSIILLIAIVMNVLQQNKFKMGQLSSEQRVFIVEQYYSNKSPTKVNRLLPINEYILNRNIKIINKVFQ